MIGSRSQKRWLIVGAALVCVLIALKVRGQFPAEVTARVIVHFVSPAAAESRRASDHESLTASHTAWQNPVAWATLRLADPELPQWLNGHLKARPSSSKAAEQALTLREQSALTVREISPGNLEILVTNPQPTEGLSICEALVAYLEMSGRRELDKEVRRTDSEEAAIHEETSMVTLEERFQAEGLDRRRTLTDFALQRYAETVREVSRERSLRAATRARLESTRPRLVVIWGPAIVQVTKVADYLPIMLGTLMALLVLRKLNHREG